MLGFYGLIKLTQTTLMKFSCFWNETLTTIIIILYIQREIIVLSCGKVLSWALKSSYFNKSVNHSIQKDCFEPIPKRWIDNEWAKNHLTSTIYIHYEIKAKSCKRKQAAKSRPGLDKSTGSNVSIKFLPNKLLDH